MARVLAITTAGTMRDSRSALDICKGPERISTSGTAPAPMPPPMMGRPMSSTAFLKPYPIREPTRPTLSSARATPPRITGR
ncbi:hypothetical protein D3C84_698840 [compost metagenome]